MRLFYKLSSFIKSLPQEDIPRHSEHTSPSWQQLLDQAEKFPSINPVLIRIPATKLLRMSPAEKPKISKPDTFPGLPKSTASTGALHRDYLPCLAKAASNLEEALNLQADNHWPSENSFSNRTTTGTKVSVNTSPARIFGAVTTFNKALQLLSKDDLQAIIEAQSNLLLVVARHPNVHGASQILWTARSSGLKRLDLAFLLPIQTIQETSNRYHRCISPPPPPPKLARSDQLQILALPLPPKTPSASYRLTPYLPLQAAQRPHRHNPQSARKDRRDAPAETPSIQTYSATHRTRSPSTPPTRNSMPSPSKRRRTRPSPHPNPDAGRSLNFPRGPGRPRKESAATDNSSSR